MAIAELTDEHLLRGVAVLMSDRLNITPQDARSRLRLSNEYNLMMDWDEVTFVFDDTVFVKTRISKEQRSWPFHQVVDRILKPISVALWPLELVPLEESHG